MGLIHVSLFYTLESFKAGSFSQNNIISRLISFCALDFGLIYCTSLHVYEYIVPASIKHIISRCTFNDNIA